MNVNFAECLVKSDGLLAAKVTNVCTGEVAHAYYSTPHVVGNLLAVGLVAAFFVFIALLVALVVSQ